MLNALVRHPQRIESAILVNGGPGGVSSPAARQVLFERGQQAIDHGMPSVVDETFGRWFTPAAQRSNPPGVALAREILLEMDPYAWNDIWRANATSEPVPDERIAGIGQPVSLVAATNDAVAAGRASAPFHDHLRPGHSRGGDHPWVSLACGGRSGVARHLPPAPEPVDHPAGALGLTLAR